MRLSACYIVKNEAYKLRQSLESLIDAVGELIVVDTGSTDNTVAVAKEFGANVYSLPWTDDFAKARNFALDRASGDWVIFIDADEYFSPATYNNLENIIAKYGEYELFLVPWHNIEETTGEVLLDSYAPRIFRNRANRRYVGRIHEELRDGGKLIDKIKVLAKDELEIVHTGYSAGLTQIKGERNLRILLQDLEQARTDDEINKCYRYLAETYANMDDMENAEYYARLDIAGGRKNTVYASRSYEILLGIYVAKGDKNGRLKVAEQASREFPELIAFGAEYAEALAAVKRYSEAARVARQALAITDVPMSLEPGKFNSEDRKLFESRSQIWEKIASRADSIRIASCLIVRNGEQDIIDWLTNSRQFADERIVVDTGSTDDTLRLIQDSDCQIHEILWDNDFATARNIALAKANADWAAVLDVDEVIIEPERVREYLAGLELLSPETDALMVTIRHVDEESGDLQGEAPHIRFLRLDRGLTYSGRVHERLVKKEGELKIQHEPAELAISHAGYSVGRIKAKHRRNLKLLEQEIAEKGQQMGHNRYLGDSYFGLGDYVSAEHYFREAIKETAVSIGAQSHLYRQLLDCLNFNGKSLNEQLELAKESLELFPQIPDFYGRLGLLYDSLDEDKLSIEHLAKALQMSAKNTDNQVGEASDFALIADRVKITLIRLSLEYDRLDEATAIFQELNIDDIDESVLEIFIELHKKTGYSDEDILNALNESFISRGLNLNQLKRMLKNLGYLEFLADEDWRADKITAEELINSMVDSLPGLVNEIPELLLRLGRLDLTDSDRLMLYKRLRSLLPDSMREFWEYYDEPANYTEPANLDGYQLLANSFMIYAAPEALIKLIYSLRPYGEASVLELMKGLMSHERYPEVFAVYQYWLDNIEELGELGEDSLYDLALSLVYMGETEVAMTVVEECLRIKPDYRKAIELKELISC